MPATEIVCIRAQGTAIATIFPNFPMLEGNRIFQPFTRIGERVNGARRGLGLPPLKHWKTNTFSKVTVAVVALVCSSFRSGGKVLTRFWNCLLAPLI